MLALRLFLVNQYAFFSQHLVSEVHLQHARNPSKFECIDALIARHQPVLIEQAVNREINHHVLKLLMLKHPKKFAELDWIFPKLARWLALQRQAEKNVAERDAAKACAANVPNSDNDLKQHSPEIETNLSDPPALPLPSLLSSVLLETNAATCSLEPHLCSSSRSIADSRKRSFDQTLSLSGSLRCGASQSHNDSLSAAECTRSVPCTEIAPVKLVARPTRTSCSSVQFGDLSSSSSSMVRAYEPSVSSSRLEGLVKFLPDTTLEPLSEHLAISFETPDASAEFTLLPGNDSATATSSQSSSTGHVLPNGTDIRVPIISLTDSIAYTVKYDDDFVFLFVAFKSISRTFVFAQTYPSRIHTEPTDLPTNTHSRVRLRNFPQILILISTRLASVRISSVRYPLQIFTILYPRFVIILCANFLKKHPTTHSIPFALSPNKHKSRFDSFPF